jgi:CheY-like chemotaxis protein
LKTARLQTAQSFCIWSCCEKLEAVEAAQKFRPDVILLDIGLPKLNGFEAARRIRKQPWGKTVLMVALTGWGTG